MSAAVTTLQVGPIIGYRVWRVMPFTMLDGEETYRLCSAGTQGRPPVWEPRQAKVAVCSDFHTTHEAPRLEHECGVWALLDAESAEARIDHFQSTSNGVGAAGWAFGSVSLWGVVVEHELGWRAQYAYPFDVTVLAPSRDVADEIRRAYAIDVTYEERVWEEVKTHDVDTVDHELNDILARLKELADGLADHRDRLGAISGISDWQRRVNAELAADPLSHGMYYVSDDRIVEALRQALGEDGTATARDVVNVLSPNTTRDGVVQEVGTALWSLSGPSRGCRVLKFELESPRENRWVPVGSEPWVSDAIRARLRTPEPLPALDAPAQGATLADTLMAVVRATTADRGAVPHRRILETAGLPLKEKSVLAAISRRLVELRERGLVLSIKTDAGRLWTPTPEGRKAATDDA